MEVAFDNLALKIFTLEKIRKYRYSGKNSKTTIYYKRIALHWYWKTRGAEI